MRKLPPLAAIRAFEAAARHLNYTRAGEELGLTQAAVSYQIRNLEQRVGAPLFMRNGRTMELTATGRALAPRISQAFEAMEGAFAAIGEEEGSVLAIACFQTFATKILAPRLGAFQLAHPEIAVRLVVGDEFVDLESGGCDIAIRLSRDVPKGLEVHELAPLAIAPLACPDFIARNPQLAKPKAGAGSAIDEAQRISAGNALWQEWDAAHCVERAERMTARGLEFDSQVLDGAAALGGNGVAMLAPLLFAQEIADGSLVQIGEKSVYPDSTFRLIYPEVRRHSAKVRAFRDWMRAEMKLLTGGPYSTGPYSTGT